jgi:hypothetical protein
MPSASNSNEYQKMKQSFWGVESPVRRADNLTAKPTVYTSLNHVCYEFSATLTPDRLNYKLEAHPLVKEGAQDEEQSNCRAKKSKKTNLVMGPKEVPDTKTDD